MRFVCSFCGAPSVNYPEKPDSSAIEWVCRACMRKNSVVLEPETFYDEPEESKPVVEFDMASEFDERMNKE